MSLPADSPQKQFIYVSDQSAPTFFISFLPKHAAELKEQQKSVLFVGPTFVAGICGNPEHLNLDLMKEIVSKNAKSMTNAKINDKVKFDAKIKGKKPVQTDKIAQLLVTGQGFKVDTILSEIKDKFGFVEI